jgi:hypothetical protein
MTVVLFELELVKKYNTQVQFGIWGVDVGLSNYVKNKFAISILIFFILNTLIICWLIVFIWINCNSCYY